MPCDWLAGELYCNIFISNSYIFLGTKGLQRGAELKNVWKELSTEHISDKCGQWAYIIIHIDT